MIWWWWWCEKWWWLFLFQKNLFSYYVEGSSGCGMGRHEGPGAMGLSYLGSSLWTLGNRKGEYMFERKKRMPMQVTSFVLLSSSPRVFSAKCVTLFQGTSRQHPVYSLKQGNLLRQDVSPSLKNYLSHVIHINSAEATIILISLDPHLSNSNPRHSTLNALRHIRLSLPLIFYSRTKQCQPHRISIHSLQRLLDFVCLVWPFRSYLHFSYMFGFNFSKQFSPQHREERVFEHCLCYADVRN